LRQTGQASTDGERAAAEAGGEGFTIVEVAVAMAIFLTVMLAVLAMFDSSHRLFARSRLLTKATNLATAKMADFRLTDLAAIVNGNDTVNTEGTAFSRTWNVSNVDVDGDGNPDFLGDIKKVDVVVSWTFNSDNHQVRMATVTTGKPDWGGRTHVRYENGTDGASRQAVGMAAGLYARRSAGDPCRPRHRDGRALQGLRRYAPLVDFGGDTG
jgi:type II secretory pathway pseudopilin PulG